MKSFIYTGLPARVVFGRGTIGQLVEELDALSIKRALVLSTPPQKDQASEILEALGATGVGLFSEAAMHTPTDVTERALVTVNNLEADGVVSFGGGSTIGLGKAIALRTDLPQLVIPTTYAGSEMTSIIGQTENGLKTTQKTLKVLPETVIYDVDYTLSLPPIMSITSGLNAIAHAVEALYAENTNPVLSLMAAEGIGALVRALPVITKNPVDVDARSEALYGAWLCAVCLGSGGVALHHKLCHVLGGSFGLPHAETHTVILPHALAYNAPAVSNTMQRLRVAMNTETPATALFDIAKNGGAPTSLKELGMPEDGIERAVEIALKNPYYNPRPLEAGALMGLLENAYEGRRPSC